MTDKKPIRTLSSKELRAEISERPWVMPYNEIIKGVNMEDGKHPDYPILMTCDWKTLMEKDPMTIYDWETLMEIDPMTMKTLMEKDPMTMELSTDPMTMGLPTVVVYEPNEEGETDHIGVIFAVGNTMDGLCVHVMSEYKGEMHNHLIHEPPSRRQPAYLLMKKQYKMNAP